MGKTPGIEEQPAHRALIEISGFKFEEGAFPSTCSHKEHTSPKREVARYEAHVNAFRTRVYETSTAMPHISIQNPSISHDQSYYSRRACCWLCAYHWRCREGGIRWDGCDDG